MQRNFAGFHSLYGADYLLKAAFSRYAFIDVVVCAKNDLPGLDNPPVPSYTSFG